MSNPDFTIPKMELGNNPSDGLLVTKDKGVLQSRVPYTKEWMYLEL